MADFDAALERVIAGVQSQRVLNAHEKRVVAFHEAGHALCGELLPSVDRVHRISIVPRGRALGYTLNLPAEDRYLKTREELLDYMTVLLGGRVAEQVVFGAITTGASDDLKRVAEISHSMVHDFAMGTAGVGRSPEGDVRLSETTLRIRDEERQDLIEEARRAAQKLIVAHRVQLDALARELLEHEVLDRDAIDRIMDGVPRLERAPGVGPARRGRRRAAGARAPRAHPRRSPLPEPARRGRRRAAIDCGCVFSRIDHVGVAVEEIDPALELYRDSFELTLAHREVVEEQGVEAVLLDVGENHVELLAPLGAGHARRQVPRQARPGPAPRRLPGHRHRRDARRAARGGPAADRRAAAHRHPRLARGVPAPARDRRRAHRDRRAGERGEATDGRRRTPRHVGFQGGQVLALRVSDEQLEALLQGARRRRLARARERGRAGAPRSRAGRLRARGGRAMRARSASGSSTRLELDALRLDERLLRVGAHARAHAARERAVARFSRLGEHGGVWLAIGVAGAALDRERSGALAARDGDGRRRSTR